MSEQQDVAAGSGAVVVGVDDSPGGGAALTAALDEAGRRGAPVVAVLAYDTPELWALELGADPIMNNAELHRQVTRVAARLVDEVVADADDAHLPEVRVLARAGSAADVLCRVAREAALLVVGHRGRGALATRLIGSVGLGVVVHATCPVLVVRPAPAASAPPAPPVPAG